MACERPAVAPNQQSCTTESAAIPSEKGRRWRSHRPPPANLRVWRPQHSMNADGEKNRVRCHFYSDFVLDIGRRSTLSMQTHDVRNQVPPLVDYNLFTSDRVLVEALERRRGAWATDRAGNLARFWDGRRRSPGASRRTTIRRCCTRTTLAAIASTRCAFIRRGMS